MAKQTILRGIIVEEEIEWSLHELSEACAVHREWLIALVDEGILEPSGNDMDSWRFNGEHLQRARAVQRLQQDLGINLPGSALVLELLAEIESLRNKLAALENS